MLRFIKSWLAVVATFVAATAIQAAGPISTEPTLIVQIKSIEGIVNDGKYFLSTANRADKAEEIDGVISAWAGPDGIAGSGIDPKRPIYAYAIAKTRSQDSPAALMIPVDKPDTFIKFLESHNVPLNKSDDGCYSLEIPGRPVAIFMRFANSYAYVTAMEKSNIDQTNLVVPEKLKAKDANTLVGLTLRIDQVPEPMKQLVLGKMDMQLADMKNRKEPGESPQQSRVRREGVDAMGMVTKTILSEGKSLQLNFVVDRAKDDLNLFLALDGKPGTAMSTIISAMAGGPSKFAPAQDAAFHVGFNFALPDLIRPIVSGLIDMGTQDIVARETDDAKRKQNVKLLDAVVPTLKKGIIDFHIMAGAKTPGGKFNLLAALGVENGPAIESAVKDLVHSLPANEKDKIQLDVTKAGDVNVHRIKVDEIDAQAKRIFGDNANLWAGFSKSALMVGMGANSEEVVQAVTKTGATTRAPLLVIEGSLRPLASLDENKTAAEVAGEVFGKAPAGADRFRLSLDGGQQLKLSFAIKGTAVRFANQLREKRGG